MPRLPAVLNFREDLPDLLNVFVAPKAGTNIAQLYERRDGDLFCCDVAFKRNKAQTQLLRNIASSVVFHCDTSGIRYDS